MTTSSPVLSESRALTRLAVPLILSQVAQVLMGLVDTVMAGHAGARELAVVALGVALWIPVFVSLMNVVQALSPVVAHHFGAGDREAVARDTREGVWLAVWVSMVPLLLLPWADDLFIAAGVPRDLAESTSVYLWGIGIGVPAAMVYRALAFYSASINRTRPVMVIAFIALGLNAFLNWVFIYGHFGAPALGGAGCGWATGICMWVSMLSLIGWTAHAPAYKPYYLWRDWKRPHWPAQKRLLRIGLPMGGAGMAEAAAFTGVAVLVGRFGEVQIGSHQIAMNFAALVFMLPMGLASALSIRVGQALGAGEPARARFIAWTGVMLGLIIAAAAMGPIIVFRHEVAALYTDDAAVRAVGANLLLFAAFWQLFDATQVTALGALRGYKVTLLPMVLMLLAFWLVGLPVGAWLGYWGPPGREPMQVYGFWIGLVVGLVLVSGALALLLRKVARETAARRA